MTDEIEREEGESEKAWNPETDPPEYPSNVWLDMLMGIFDALETWWPFVVAAAIIIALIAFWEWR